MNNEFERELAWDDEIEKESEFILLPEGEYEFEVVSFERGRHNGSDKLPPCPKAIITLNIKNELGIVTLKHNLFLHSKCEGLLSAFFICIGQKKHGERLRMNWNNVIGAKGRAKIGIRKWTKDNGQEGSTNDIKSFCEPIRNAEPADYTPQPTAGGFVPGKF